MLNKIVAIFSWLTTSPGKMEPSEDYLSTQKMSDKSQKVDRVKVTSIQ